VAAGAKENFEYDSMDRLVSPSKKVTINAPGDANEDGVIDSLDTDYVARVILESALQLQVLTPTRTD